MTLDHATWDVAIVGESRQGLRSWFLNGLQRVMTRRGYRFHDRVSANAHLVLNFLQSHRPRPFHRRSKSTFVVSIAEDQQHPQSVLKAGYPLLVRALSNLLVYLIHSRQGPLVYFVTLEQGCYQVPGAASEEEFFERVYDRLAPLATSTLFIDNEFTPDLAVPLWGGDAVTEQIHRAGQRLDRLGLLPAPFPLEDLVPPDDLRHIKLLYGIGGLSYGNLSARAADRAGFWMSASGVDKSNLVVVGRDILLVRGYDRKRGVIQISIPPELRPRRASVDAIEHALIYEENPGVGAIVHVHAWMDGVPSTRINYPCGTWELARAVSDLVRQAPDPTRAVVGLANHGLTITGPNLDDIFARIDGKIIPQLRE
jgi:hypothetical protein